MMNCIPLGVCWKRGKSAYFSPAFLQVLKNVAEIREIGGFFPENRTVIPWISGNLISATPEKCGRIAGAMEIGGFFQEFTGFCSDSVGFVSDSIGFFSDSVAFASDFIGFRSQGSGECAAGTEGSAGPSGPMDAIDAMDA